MLNGYCWISTFAVELPLVVTLRGRRVLSEPRNEALQNGVRFTSCVEGGGWVARRRRVFGHVARKKVNLTPFLEHPVRARFSGRLRVRIAVRWDLRRLVIGIEVFA